MDATALKLALADRADVVCEHLLPSGKRHGREWKVGGFDNSPGTSLSICIAGEKVGLFSDFATGQKGSNLIDLWMAVRGMSYGQALADAAKWAGVSTDDPMRHVARPKAAPAKPVAPVDADFLPLDPAREVFDYLVNDRKIPADILARYRVGQQRGAYVFPSYSADGKSLEMWKAVALDRPDGKKKTRTSAGTAKVLFGKHACAGHAGTLAICEGEIDAMTVAQYGFAAVSVPYGAKCDDAQGNNPNQAWIANDWPWLEQFHTILLCFDADEAGQAAARDLVPRLGRERCSFIRLPAGRKDANECLTAGLGDGLAQSLIAPVPCDPPEITRISDHLADIERDNDPDAPEAGTDFLLPIEFRVRPAELTIWTGTSGSGKTTFLLNVLAGQAAQGQRCCIASFEMAPRKTFNVLACQIGNVERPSGDQLHHIAGWIEDRFYIYHTEKRVVVPDMLETFRYMRRRYGVTQFMVDSLMMCGMASDDYVAQKMAVEAMVNFAKAERVHFHLVAHSRKLASDKSQSDKMDVKGASEITDLGFNIVHVHRDLEKEEARQKGEFSDEPDGKMFFSKQRETGVHPYSPLYFDPRTRRFRATKHDHGRPFITTPLPFTD